MPLVVPQPEADAPEKVAQTYSRIKDMWGGKLPEPFLLYGRVPAFLQDFYMNFKKFVWTDGHLPAPLKATIALAVSATLRCERWSSIMAARCGELGASEQHVADTLAIASTCQMYNVFFKFRDVSGSDLFSGMGVGLRAHAFANTSLDEKTVELINIAISDINGCKPCTSGHVEKSRQLGTSDEAILEAVQCAATMAAGCGFLSGAGHRAVAP